jgi:hypothetical protein
MTDHLYRQKIRVERDRVRDAKQFVVTEVRVIKPEPKDKTNAKQADPR